MGNPANFAVLGALFAAARLMGGVSDPQPQLSVLVYDFAGVPRAMLRTAEKQSDLILNAAGVKLLWTQCSVTPGQPGPDQACPYEPGPDELVVHILPQGSASRRTDANALGFALPAEGNRFAYYAGIFYDRIAAAGQGARTPALLGGVIAHEIGHLLLGEGRHSFSGIMRPEWRKQALKLVSVGALVFSAEERRRITANVQLRVAAQGTVRDSALAAVASR